MRIKIRSLLCGAGLMILSGRAFTQISVDSISVEDIKATVSFLAADELQGRGNFTQHLLTAADFISDRFQQSGLITFPRLETYFQPFQLRSTKGAMKDQEGNYLPQNVLLNVLGVLEGRSKRDEVVIFSAHYDHVGGQAGEVLNGANDNASGTAAVVALANYFARRNDNERTIIFCAFAGEELGLFGSAAFAPHLIPEKVVAVINIEMIGKTSVGKNAFFVTGAGLSDVAAILGRNLGGKAKIRHEPNSSRRLFQRSDNFSFAKEGIPAHTIMSSDDTDPCYHQPCDVIKSLDFDHMTSIIRAIATGTQTLVSGQDTPRRINPSRIK